MAISSLTRLGAVLEHNRSLDDRWYVTSGYGAVGPVHLELLERGIEAGLVPLHSFVRHERWNVWKPLADLADLAPHPQTATPSPARLDGAAHA